MALDATPAKLAEIIPLREIFLRENSFQIRYNACHERNWTDSYILRTEGMTIGYGSVKGKENHADRDTIFEFFLLPPFRKMSLQLFCALSSASDAKYVETQTNEKILTSLLFESGRNIIANAILFSDQAATNLSMPGFIFRERRKDDLIFAHSSEPEGDWLLERNGEVVATGGFLLHYNQPFADLYYEVQPAWRQRGIGSFFFQELKKACYLAGRVPASRCNVTNHASRRAMMNAGMGIAGYMLSGELYMSKELNKTKESAGLPGNHGEVPGLDRI